MTESTDNTGRCLICEQPVPTHDLIGHIRVMHPDQYEEPLSWPDGGNVVTHQEITVEDFTGGAA